jgi:hypothetical protein
MTTTARQSRPGSCRRRRWPVVVVLTLAAGMVGMPPARAVTFDVVTGIATPGSDVTISAWPVGQIDLAPGATVRPVKLASVPVDSTGRFAANLDTSGLAAQYRTSIGTVPVEIDAAGATQFGETGSLPDTVSATPSDVLAATSRGRCSTYEGWYDNGWEYRREERYSLVWARPHAPATLEQHIGSDHSIQVAMNLSNGAGWGGSYSQTVEQHREAGASQIYYYPRYVYNSVNWHRYWRKCADGRGHIWNEYMARVESFADFYTDRQDGPNPALAYCFTHGNGYTLHKTTGSGFTFDLGTSIAEVANLNVHAGYTSDNVISWAFDDQVKMCGDKQVGPVESNKAGAEKIESSGTGCPIPPCPGKLS